MHVGVNMRGSRDAPWARSAMRVLAVLALCVAPSTSFVVAPRPRAPPPRLALPGAVEFALRGKALPPEAVAALVYAAPLPPLRATLRRLRGKASTIAPAPPRGRFAAAYVLALLAYALRDAAPASKAACLFAGLRLATRPPYGADARTAPARPSRAAHAAAAVALAGTLHAAALHRAALAGAARRAGAQVGLWLAALDAYCARVLPTKFYDGHVFRFFWGLGIALTANFWLTELAAKREKPDDKGDV